ncbi:unnamed protein product [Heligmosomoides polygyrus]|uniref:Cell division protein ZapA n=1 Tax=Heligmosomoides polygyrus TaxID=6339 RepID=A0A183FV00_HELPZ|nr:unnamed protein product [Heligmosomoides polygyrus]
MHPELPLLGVGQDQNVAVFALEQLVLEFERIRESEYDTPPETSDNQVRERATADIEELEEILRRRDVVTHLD